MRLGDMDALLEAYDAAHEGPPGKARALILNAPTVDAVPVVRCSECRYCFDEDRETPYDGESWWYCARWDKETSAYGTDPYRFYCADGERKEAEQDAHANG